MRLGDVVELRRGFDLPHRDRQNGPYPVLSAGVAAGWHNVGPVKGPGMVVGRATNLGVPTWSHSDFWPLNTTLYAASFHGNSPRWVFHLFENLDLSGYDSGSVQPMLNRNYILDIAVPVPLLNEQLAIAEVLGALDDKIAANRAAAETTRNIAAACFTRGHSATHSTGRVKVAFAELIQCSELEVGDGYRTKRAEQAGRGFQIIRVTDVVDGTVIPTGPDSVAEGFAKAIGGKAGRPGDVVLTTKGTVGRVALTPELDEQIVYSPQICYFRCSEDSRVDRFYLRYWFESAEFRLQADHRMNNTDMAPYISLTDIRSLQLTIPEPDHMRALSDHLATLENTAQALLRENAGLANLRDTLLPHLMSGRLRVKDAEKQVEEVL